MNLSVIVLNYNTKDLTISCLKSLDKYPYKEVFEVIVVDNASSDDSVREIKKLKARNYKLKVIKNPGNVGFSKGNNVGIRKAKGKYILLLNSDTVLTKNALNGLVRFAEQNENVGVVAPKLLNPNNTVQESVFNLPGVLRAVKQYIFKSGRILDKYAPAVKVPVEVEGVVGAAFLITPEARKKVGLLDPRYFMYFEDLDYCRRVRKAGLKVFYLPGVSIIHHHGASGKGNQAQFERLVKSSKVYHGLFKYYLLTLIIKLGTR